MATAAGKTHVLHACLALLEDSGLGPWQRILIITPSESLSRQHARKLRNIGGWNIFLYPDSGDASAIGQSFPGTVVIIDINKLTEAKTGEGVSIPTSVFKNMRNLVFVDEGHKGRKTEASVWKRLQEDLAGIGELQARHRGLLIEFSATFGQVAEKEKTFDHYAKSIIFDYAYDRFHADLYGKDFWHLKADPQEGAEDAVQRHILTSALASYWHQLRCFQDIANGAITKPAHEMSFVTPLWILLGLSVIGGQKSDADKTQTSDVVGILLFLARILESPEVLSQSLGHVLAQARSGDGLLPDNVLQAMAGRGPDDIARDILNDVFGWRSGEFPVFRLLANAGGEMGLGLAHGDHVRYYGVVNVGDVAGLKKEVESQGLKVDHDAFASSLFAGLDREGSGVNLLIGSRRFAEGWDNYRASSLTLLQLGQGEGSLIIQMFGRVLRFSGCNGDGKRLQNPPVGIRPLQTAYVYGLRSSYLKSFLDNLHDNGMLDEQHVECPVADNLPAATPIKSVQTVTPPPERFAVQAIGRQWLSSLNTVNLSLGASLVAAGLTDDGVHKSKTLAGKRLTDDFKQLLPLVDMDAVHREMTSFKRTMKWWNFWFDHQAVLAALESDRYEVFGLPSALEMTDLGDIARVNRLAASIVRHLFEAAYRRQRNQQTAYTLVPAKEAGVPSR
ncbi:DEAD/DEAH box helicase family protein [Desulfonatronum thioautotrophicum]|uniref:DEAD/DEAH box helicase family protein n=1 Tax=Desulfonatronum thioautotrophicum TaxID=617001 RepID=UPI000A99E8F5|nr:DEAD/DEAH box helicase family protein [Desulfonatronum thioautotrophicum]